MGDLHIQLSDDGQHIRRWAREPFDGSTRYAEVPDTPQFAPQAERLREALEKVRGEVAATYGYEPNDSVRIKLGMIDGYAATALAAALSPAQAPEVETVEAHRRFIEDEQRRAQTYLEEYVLSTDGADYVPTEHERALIEDALQGWLAEQPVPARAVLSPAQSSDAALRAALKPFADEAARFDYLDRPAVPHPHWFDTDELWNGAGITVGDLRRARTAHNGGGHE